MSLDACVFACSFNSFSSPLKREVLLALMNSSTALGELAWAQCRFLSCLKGSESFYFKVVYKDVFGKETTKPPYYLGII